MKDFTNADAILTWGYNLTYDGYVGTRPDWHPDDEAVAAYLARAVRIAAAYDAWDESGDASFVLPTALCAAAEGEDK